MNHVFNLLRENVMERTGDCICNEEERYVRFGIEGKRFSTEATIAIAHGLIAMFIVFPFRIPKKRLRAIAEYLMRINGEIMIGSFHVNFKEEKVSFYIAVPIEEENITKKQIADIIQTMLDQSMRPVNWMSDSFMCVAFKNMSPSMAVQMMNQIETKPMAMIESKLTDIESIHQN